MSERMKPDRLDHIESRIPLREDYVARAQIQELVDEVRHSWANEGPSPAWLKGIEERSRKELNEKEGD